MILFEREREDKKERQTERMWDGEHDGVFFTGTKGGSVIDKVHLELCVREFLISHLQSIKGVGDSVLI